MKEDCIYRLLNLWNSWCWKLLPTTKKSGQGNVFTGVCDSVHGGGLPQCMLGYHRPLGAYTPPPEQTPPWEQTPPQSRHPPPQEQTPPPHRSGLWHTVNERPVRILLECILVFIKWSPQIRGAPVASWGPFFNILRYFEDYIPLLTIKASQYGFPISQWALLY